MNTQSPADLEQFVQAVVIRNAAQLNHVDVANIEAIL
jgi:hypothetical protein